MDRIGNTMVKLKGISSLIGNTPLLAISFRYKGEKRVLYAKAEYLNMTGSIKDRMAFHIIKQAYTEGKLIPGGMIIEATSGNTGIAFSAIGRALGHPITIFMPDWMSSERINLIRSFGADIKLISREEGGFIASISRSNDLANETPDSFLPKQFSNIHNANAHYHTTGPEIWAQLRFRSLIPDAFITGVGTGGTIMGTGKYLKEKNPSIKIHPLEPSNSPTLSTGCKVGLHRIQGISDDFIPDILDLKSLDDVVGIDDGDSIIMAQKLADVLGIGVGVSSGANLLGALKLQNQMGKDSVVVTVFSDDNKKYLSTDLLKEEPVKDGFLSTDVELRGFRSFKRVCYTCCNPEECVEANSTISTELGLLPACPRRA